MFSVPPLLAKNKLGFINEECKKPDPWTSKYQQWEMCDNMVMQCILNLLAKEIADIVEYVNDSFDYGENWRIDMTRRMEQNHIIFKQK